MYRLRTTLAAAHCEPLLLNVILMCQAYPEVAIVFLHSTVSADSLSMAVITGINIIDRDRLWWPSISTSSTLPSHGWTHPRNVGFCSYTLLSEAAEVLVVEDAQKDVR